MKKSGLLILLFLTFFANAQKSSNDYQNLWEKVYEAELNLLPKSSSSKVNEIYKRAVKEQNEVQKIKCLLYQSKFALTLEENAQLKVVNNFKSAIETTKNKTSKALLNSLLAHVYWDYFKKNRWSFYNRTKTEEVVNNDFRTWDLKTLYTEIHKHFYESLKDKEILKNTKYNAYEVLIDEYEGNKNGTSTLFDFLAYNALEFYQENESSITKPKEPFVIDKKEYLTEIEIYSFTSKDTLSTKYLSLKLYQELIKLHKNNEEAYFTTLLRAVDYVKDHSNIEKFNEVKLSYLKELKQKYKPSKARAFIDFEIAKMYAEFAETYQPKSNTKYQYDFKKALEICNVLLQKYPKHEFSNAWKGLKNKIEFKELSCTVEKYVPIDQQLKALISYRNVNVFAGTLYKVNKTQYQQIKNENRSAKKDSLLKKLPVFKEWQLELLNKKDHQKHSTEILLPKVPQGQYILVGDFNKNKTQNHYTFFQVTNLTLLKKQEGDFQVLDRFDGTPYVNAKVNLENSSSSYKGSYNINKEFLTNDKGSFEFKNNHYYRNVQATVTTQKDTAYFENIYLYAKKKSQKNTNTNYKPFVFTDRSIYRPGQKVFFKAIVLKKEGEVTEILSNQSIEVGLYDVNGQEVEKLSLQLNEFGTVASIFQLPISGLNGQYSFRAYYEGKNIGYVNTRIAVEEYKRPKFETSFKPVTDTFRVNDSVTVQGEATALSGSKITNAKVVYRVVRKVNFPRWCWWGNPPSSTEIEHGETTTDIDGNYKVKFKALPDIDVDKKNQPIFYYTIYADVTDINGETRSTETKVAVGYHTLDLSLSAKIDLNVCDKNSVIITSENLNGQFVATKGSIKIYKLIAPEIVYRNRPWTSPDIQSYSKEEYQELFPFETYEFKDLKPKNWKKGMLVFSKTFDTEKKTKISLGTTKKWEIGKYIMVAESEDEWGQTVKDEQIVTLFNPKANKVSDNQLFQISLDKDTYHPEGEVIVSIGSSVENMTVFVEIEKDHKTVATHQVQLNNEIKKIKIPVVETDRGGFAVKWHRVNYNNIDSGVLNVIVPHLSKNLDIETLTFRDLLEPGATQKWSFKIKGVHKEKATAEVLASMYDVSLDQFKPHNWQFNPVQLPTYRTRNYIYSFNNFQTTSFSVKENGYRNFYHRNEVDTDEFNWFGFSFINNSWVNKHYLREIKNNYFGFDNSQKTFDASLGTGQIKVTAVNENQEVLPGVIITGAFTSDGILTDFDGQVLLKAKENNVLIFNYLGFKKVKLKIDKDYNSYVVVLYDTSSSLEEVVTVGYGTMRKGRLTGSVSEVSYDDSEVQTMKGIKIGTALQGKVSGLHISEAILVKEEVLMKNLEQVKPRTNFNETAFFFPQLKTDENGEVSFEFTMPEDLTRWKLQLLAHDKELNSATKTLTTVTQKQLMVIPNPPRFLREGDEITLSTKISNLTEGVLQGKVKLELTDAVTGKNIDKLLQNYNASQDFSVAANGNTSASWKLQIPENVSAVQYKIVAATNDFSDGEQNVLPVLSNRMLVTETLPLWVNGDQSKTFALEGLKNNESETLKHHQLTLEMTSNPAWYAVQALPYLMEYPYECAEQTFARYYANQLASHIVNSNPKIKEVFQQWANSDALVSNLEKNEELKSIIIQETPWLRDAQSETEQKKRIALLFNLSKMKNSLAQTIQKLEKMQFANGAFPWFSGSEYPNRYITQHIVQGFAHLKHLGVSINNQKIEKLISKAQVYLDTQLIEDYDRLIVQSEKIKSKAKTDKEGIQLAKDYMDRKHLYSFQLQYLYIRSFDLKEIKNKKLSKAITYYSNQSAQFWKEETLYNKGLIALIQYRNNHVKTADDIVKSLEENSITADEMGMYWKENKASWHWYQSPIETQSLLIETFSEIKQETKTVDNLKKWLLKNKQTQQWKTTKATSEAIYALLLQGSDWLAINESVEINIGGKKLDVNTLDNVKAEVGTGYFKTKWSAKEVNSDMATITIAKKTKGVAWGGLYWQYFEDLDKIKTSETSLKINKKVFVKTNTDNGLLLTELANNTALKVGDLLTVRIELSTDRDMEFIHMKDMRAAGLEPVDVLSGYKYQDRLGYYQSTKDASTHFFFDKIVKGIYVFEYDVRVSHKGMFSNGITTIQSMYAPEFSSHSNGISIEVK